MKYQVSKKDIAIVGMSGTFPDSENLNEFWENLIGEKELIRFYGDEELLKLGVDQKTIDNPHFVKADSKLSNAAYFDYPFFGYSREEAELMDPQTRLLHEHVWAALENSNCQVDVGIEKIGLFVAASDNVNWRAHALMNPHPAVSPFFTNQISNKEFSNTLISYNLNLRGPSYFIDTACSSSLVATHIACRNLLMKECSIAVAGGVRIDTNDTYGYHFQEGLIHSRDGHCKPFDASSTGAVAGEGVGVIVLKRAEDAIKNKDTIYAIIRSSATNNDGKRKIGYTAPSIQGQIDCIRLAHRVGQVDPASISYVEAHGTGTNLGDPVEIEALNQAFGVETQNSCAIGSAKSNMGHLDTAAGIAGLIKTTLALKNKEIPSSLHFSKPNPEINFKNGPFYVPVKSQKWETKNGAPRIAGVSSLGIGGTNAHVILQEFDPQYTSSASRKYQLVPFSGKTEAAREAYKERLEKFIKTEALNLADTSFTLATSRTQFSKRDFLIRTADGSAQALNVQNNPGLLSFSEKAQNIFMFPGSGSQYHQMAKDIYSSEPFFKNEVDTGFALFQSMSGIDLKEIVFGDKSERINENKFTQPIIFIFEHALAQLLMKWGVQPSQLIGHSTGEYVAATISGVFSYQDGLMLVYRRANLMAETPKGSMLTVGLSHEKALELTNSNVSLAAINGPEYCVLAGDEEAINKIHAELENAEIICSKLRVTMAGHSFLMDSVLLEYQNIVAGIELRAPQIPIISNVTGKVLENSEATSAEYWVNHMRQPVLFKTGIETALQSRNSNFLEVGPGYGLSTFVNQILKSKGVQKNVINLTRHPQDEVNDELYLINSLGKIWSTGVELNWEAYFENESRIKVAAPTYAFENHALKTRVNAFEQLNNSDAANQLFRDDIENCSYIENWKSISNSKYAIQKPSDWTLHFIGDSPVENDIVQHSISLLGKYIEVRQGSAYKKVDSGHYEVNPNEPNDYKELASDLSKVLSGKLRILNSWTVRSLKGLDPDLRLKQEKSNGYYALLNIAKELLPAITCDKIDLVLLTSGAFKVLGNETCYPERSLAISALETIQKEVENTTATCFDIELEQAVDLSLLFSSSKEGIVALRGRKVWTPVYERANEAPNESNRLKTGGVYLITGGAGGMSALLLKHLRENYNAKVILLGRSAPNAALTEQLKDDAIDYIQSDLSNKQQIEAQLKSILETKNNQLDGVFHNAGVLDHDGLIVERTIYNSENVFLPKVDGTINLFGAIQKYSPEFLLLSSSISSLAAPFGQVAYAAANTYLNHFAKANETSITVKSILWDIWKESGLASKASGESDHASWKDQLENGITDEEGIQLFEKALNHDENQIIFSMFDLNRSLKDAKARTYYSLLNVDVSAVDESVVKSSRPGLSVDFEEPKSDTEKEIQNGWERLLNIDSIGVLDNFFELGGDSLKAMIMLNAIKKQLDFDLSLKEFFKKPTIRGVVEEIEASKMVKKMQSSETKKNVIRI